VDESAKPYEVPPFTFTLNDCLLVLLVSDPIFPRTKQLLTYTLFVIATGRYWLIKLINFVLTEFPLIVSNMQLLNMTDADALPYGAFVCTEKQCDPPVPLNTQLSNVHLAL
jgi:hypothetical protein